MSGVSGRAKNTIMIRVSREEVYDELVKIQQAIYAEHHWKVSLSDIIKAKMAGQPVKP